MRNSLILGAYRTAGRVLAPTASLILARRIQRGKEDPERRDERLGHPSSERPDGPLIWVHGASVGETLAVLPLIERIREAGPMVLLTTGTRTSAKLAAERVGEGVIHQYVPLDFVPFVDRFLDHWRPDLAIFVESEIWPSITAGLRRRSIPQVLVNGRMSERSYRRWQKSRGAIEELLGGLSLCLAQTGSDGDRFLALGAPRVGISGNIKYDVPPPDADEAALSALAGEIGARHVWLAASTHPGEEATILRVHRALRKHLPSLLTIVAPRHPHRGGEVAGIADEIGLKTRLRSASETIEAETDIYVADTIGELGLFYRLVPVAFVGGSFIPHGGQNPIEPAKLATVVLHGPHVHNFDEVYRSLDGTGGAIMVETPEQLAKAAGSLFVHPDEQKRRSLAGAKGLEPFLGALERTVEALQPFLTPLALQTRLEGRG
ncbi:MAG: 3-deoxy-D-manno-octulosonic acid transferase [Hyphomicrobiales bacterium]